jgi:hypothetical protein
MESFEKKVRSKIRKLLSDRCYELEEKREELLETLDENEYVLEVLEEHFEQLRKYEKFIQKN